MIRINLLGQAKPKTSRRQVDTGAALPVLFIGAGLRVRVPDPRLPLLLLAAATERRECAHQAIAGAKDGPGTDQAAGRGVREAETGFAAARIDDRAVAARSYRRARNLLDQIANTVARTENLWLTSMVRKGNNLAIEGRRRRSTAWPTSSPRLKRSGYFQKVEIRESKQDEKNTAVQTFMFQMTAEISPPAAAPAARPRQSRSAPRSRPSGRTGEERVRRERWPIHFKICR